MNETHDLARMPPATKARKPRKPSERPHWKALYEEMREFRDRAGKAAMENEQAANEAAERCGLLRKEIDERDLELAALRLARAGHDATVAALEAKVTALKQAIVALAGGQP